MDLALESRSGEPSGVRKSGCGQQRSGVSRPSRRRPDQAGLSRREPQRLNEKKLRKVQLIEHGTFRNFVDVRASRSGWHAKRQPERAVPAPRDRRAVATMPESVPWRGLSFDRCHEFPGSRLRCRKSDGSVGQFVGGAPGAPLRRKSGRSRTSRRASPPGFRRLLDDLPQSGESRLQGVDPGFFAVGPGRPGLPPFGRIGRVGRPWVMRAQVPFPG